MFLLGQPKIFYFIFVSYDLKILEIPDIRWDVLKVIVTQVQSPEGLHHEEIARQLILIEIVVGQVKDLQCGEGSKSPWQSIQPVDGHVKDTQLGHGRDGHGQLLQVVVAHVQDLQVGQVGNASRQLQDTIVADSETSNEGH